MATAETARMYQRAARRVVIGVLIALSLGIYVMHSRGYAVLTGGGLTGETNNGLVLMNCRYFSGTETIIERLWRKADDGKGSCPLVRQFAPPRDGMGGIQVPPAD